MAPSSKAKAAGVSASSFLDLKAELAKKESTFTKKGAVVGGVPHGSKKATVWARPNRGVAARVARDLEVEAASRRTAESARAALERKAAIYDKLRKGKTGGLTDAQFDALLVDFDAKAPGEHYSSDSEDVDESLTVPKPPDDEDDPFVEYEDEFGRMRTARKSEVPRDLPSAQAEEEVEDDPFIVRNPVNHFPVFEPSADRVAAIQEAASEAANPLAAHYDAAREVRAKGAAFYAFSGDEDARAREMEALRRAREETERARHAAGAVDVRPGEVEGMVYGAEAGAEDEGTGKGKGKGKEVVLTARSRAMEKRKRELEERRRLVVEAKKRKMKGPDDEGGAKAEQGGKERVAADTADPFAALEAEIKSSTSVKTTEGKGKSRWDQTQKPKAELRSARAADDFLEQLEKDFVGKK